MACADARRDVHTGLAHLAKAPRPFPWRSAGGSHRAVKGEADLAAVGVAGEAQVNGFIEKSGDVVGAVSHHDRDRVGRRGGEPVFHQRQGKRMPGARVGKGKSEEADVYTPGTDFDGLRVEETDPAQRFRRRRRKGGIGFPLHRVHAQRRIQGREEGRQLRQLAFAGRAAEGLEKIPGVENQVGIQRPNPLKDLRLVVPDSARLDVGNMEHGEGARDLWGGDGQLAQLEVSGLDMGRVNADGSEQQAEDQPPGREAAAGGAQGDPQRRRSEEKRGKHEGVHVIEEADDDVHMDEAEEQQEKRVRAEKQDGRGHRGGAGSQSMPSGTWIRSSNGNAL